MRVLIDAHAAILKKTGIGRYVDELINTSKKIDTGLELCLYSNLPEKNLPKKYLKFQSYHSPFKNGVFRVFYGLNKAVSKLKPDLIHISNFAPIIKTTPIVITVHDVCFKTHPSYYPLKTRLAFNLFFERSIFMSDAIICVSRAVKRKLLSLYKIDPKKVFVVYEGASSLFKPIRKKPYLKKYLRKKYDIKNPFFLVVGNVEKRKKPLETIEVFRKLPGNNLELVFAGPQLLDTHFFKKHQKLIAEGKIKFLGYVDDKDLVKLYNSSLCLIYNSFCEGFGLPLIEAMCCKTPVIASDIPAFKEVAGDAAIFFKNPRQLLKAMENIVKDTSFRQTYAQKGYKRAKLFSWERAFSETFRIYKKVLIEKKDP